MHLCEWVYQMSTNAEDRPTAQERFFELLLEAKSSGDLQWSLLLGRLKELRKEYNDAPLANDPDAIAAGRQKTVALVVQAVSLYLNVAGCPKEDLIPLEHLIYAFVDLESGAQNPLLSPRKRVGGRPRSSLQDNLQLVYAAAAVTLYMKIADMSKEEAARLIAKAFRKLNLAFPASQIGRNRPAWKQLIDWRDKLLAGKGDRWEYLKYFYDHLVDKPDSKLALVDVTRLILDEGGIALPLDTTT